MSDFYTHLAKATNVNREDVKKVLYAASYQGIMAHELELDDNDGVTTIRIVPKPEGRVRVVVSAKGKSIWDVTISVRTFARLIRLDP